MQKRTEGSGRTGLGAHILGAGAGLGGRLEVERRDVRIGESEAGGPEERLGSTIALQPRDPGLAMLHRRLEVTLSHRQTTGEQTEHRALAEGRWKAIEPASHRLGCRPDESGPVPGYRVGGRTEVPSRQPLLDRVQRPPVRCESACHPPMERGELGPVALLV